MARVRSYRAIRSRLVRLRGPTWRLSIMARAEPVAASMQACFKFQLRVTYRMEQLWSKPFRISGNDRNYQEPNVLKAESEVIHKPRRN